MPKLAPTYEKQLLQQAARGSRRAFGRLFDVYFQKLGAYIFKVTKNRVFAEEIVQEVFIKLWEQRADLEKIQNFEAYLFRISKNRTLNFLRDRSAERIRVEKLQQEHLQLVQLPEVFTEHYYRIVDQAVSELPPRQQRIYHLVRNKNKKYDEVATEMNISKETVRKHMFLALRFLKREVAGRIDQLAILALIYFFR